MEEKTKVYDLLKICTAILVVLGHCTNMYTANAAIPPAASSSLLSSVTVFIYGFHMPLFILLSGCVYGYCIERGKYKKFIPFISKKAKRLLIPYLFFGIFTVMPVMILCHISNNSWSDYFIRGILLSKDPRHLWYVLALFLIYIIAGATVKLYKKSALLYTAFAVVVFVVSVFFAPVLQIRAALSYFIYFALGMTINKYFDIFCAILRKISFAMPIFAAAMLGVVFYNPNRFTKLGYALIGITVCFWAAAFVISKKPDLCASTAFSFLKKNLFGLYLFHPMIIYLIFYYLGRIIINPWALCAIAFAVSSLLSIALTSLFRKLRLGILMGE